MIMQTIVASRRVAAEPPGRAPGFWKTGALPGVGGSTTRRIAEGATSGGASTSPRRPTGAAEGAAGVAGRGRRGAGGAAAAAGTCWAVVGCGSGAGGAAGGDEGTSMSDGTERAAVTCG